MGRQRVALGRQMIQMLQSMSAGRKRWQEKGSWQLRGGWMGRQGRFAQKKPPAGGRTVCYDSGFLFLQLAWTKVLGEQRIEPRRFKGPALLGSQHRHLRREL